MKVEWRYSTEVYGAQCVTRIGTPMMLESCAGSWGTTMEVQHIAVRAMVEAVVQSGLTE